MQALLLQQHDPSSQIVQITQANFDHLLCLQSLLDPQATKASSSSMDAYTTYNQIINSASFSHVTGIKDKFDSLELSYKYPPIHIADKYSPRK